MNDGPCRRRARPMTALILTAGLSVLLSGCDVGSDPATLALTLASPAALIFPGQAPTRIRVNLIRQGPVGMVTLSVTGVPSGISVDVQSPGASDMGSLAFTAANAAPATYPVIVTAGCGSS